LLSNPSHNQRHNKIDLLNIQRPALLDSMPFLNTFTAAGSGCMLGKEYRSPLIGVCFPSFLKIQKSRKLAVPADQ